MSWGFELIPTHFHYEDTMFTFWRPSFSRRIPDNLQSSLNDLLDILSPFSILDQADSATWRLTPNGSFSVNSLYKLLNGTQLTYLRSKRIWKTKAQHKIKFFSWLAIHNKILSRENLLKRNIAVSDPGCPTCGIVNLETTNHILLECNFTRRIWSFVTSILHLRGHPPSVRSLWTVWRRRQVPPE